MYLLYLDASGTPESTNEEYFVLAGLAAFERRIYHLSQDLNKVQNTYFPGASSPVEFHASHIHARRSEPWKSLSYGQRKQLMQDVYSIVNDSHYPGVVLFAAAVHKASLPAHEQPLTRAFEQVCSRFDIFLKRLHSEEDKDDQRGLVIMDQCRISEKQEFRASWLEYVSSGTRWGRLGKVTDVPYFADSRASRLLQLADFCSFAVWRYYEHNDKQYFDKIVNRFDQAKGTVHGLWHFTPDRHSCWCPACSSRRR